MSLLATAAVIGASVWLGVWLGRRSRRTEGSAPSARIQAETREPALEGPGPFDGFECRLGAVVLSGHDEAWLVGAWVFSEERPVAALFVGPTPESPVLLAFPRPAQQLLWLTRVAAPSRLPGGEPPSTLEIGTTRFERWRRRPVQVDRHGDLPFEIRGPCVLAEYRGPGDERFVLVDSGGESWAWRGLEISSLGYEILSGPTS